MLGDYRDPPQPWTLSTVRTVNARFEKKMADCLQLIVLLTLDYTTKVKHMCSLATTTPYSMSWRQM